MPRPEADWKNQAGEYDDAITILVALVLVSSYVFAWWRTDDVQFVGVALIVIGWLALYVSPYWQPILYPLVAIVLVPYLALLVWQGTWALPVARVGIASTGVFLVLVLALFLREERPKPVE